MKKNLIFGAGRGPRLNLLDHLKRSGRGMGVKELATTLGMSYMGVKAHCVALVSTGYLVTWRQAGVKGRPILLYKLTDAGERLFAESGEELALGLLKEAEGLFGPTASGKLLVMYFRSLTSGYRGMIEAVGPVERARALAKLREREGRMSSMNPLREGEGWEIRESHNPMAPLMKVYPKAIALEEHMVAEVLGIPIRRVESGSAVIFSPLGK